MQRPPGRAGASRPTIGPEYSASTGVRAGSKSSPQYGAPPKVAPRQAVAAAPRSASAPSTREHRPLVTSVPAHIGRAAARAGTDAAHFVSSFAPSGAPAEKADSISTAVVLTLFAVVLAVLLGVAATHVPWFRARAWR